MNPIAKTLVRVARRGAMKAQKHLPEILLVGGSVGIVASTVLACRATIKAQPILEEAKDNIEAVHVAESDPRVSDASLILGFLTRSIPRSRLPRISRVFIFRRVRSLPKFTRLRLLSDLRL